MKVKDLIARLQEHNPENEVFMTNQSDDIDGPDLLDEVYEIYKLGNVDIEQANGEKVGEATVIYTSLIVYDPA